MALSDRYDLSDLRNQMELFVFDDLEHQLDAIADEDICKCNDCILDMACFALNKLAPSYCSSLMGTIYTKVGHSDENHKVTERVREAIEKISQNPLCENARKGHF